MAEFLNQEKLPRPEYGEGNGMDAFGRPVSNFRRNAAYQCCVKDIGLTSADAHDAVGPMAEALERDEPYLAMEAGMKYLDLTGTYRILAVLCTAEEIESE